MNEPVNFLGQPELTKREMREVGIHPAEPFFTREATERVVKMIYSTYAKSNLYKVASASVKLDGDKVKKLLNLLT